MQLEYCLDQKLEAAGLKRKHHSIIDTICQASCCLFWGGGSRPRGSAAEVRDAQGQQCLHHRGLVEATRWMSLFYSDTDICPDPLETRGGSWRGSWGRWNQLTLVQNTGVSNTTSAIPACLIKSTCNFLATLVALHYTTPVSQWVIN